MHFERKADWVMTFYKGYKTHDGVENWPAMEVDFARMQLEQQRQHGTKYIYRSCKAQQISLTYIISIIPRSKPDEMM